MQSNGNKVPLVFSDWKEIDENSFELLFSENVSLLCKLSGEKKDSLNVSVDLPKNSTEVSIPYKFSKSYTVTDSTSKKMILKSNNTQTALRAPEITSSQILLRHQMIAYHILIMFQLQDLPLNQFLKIHLLS